MEVDGVFEICNLFLGFFGCELEEGVLFCYLESMGLKFKVLIGL